MGTHYEQFPGIVLTTRKHREKDMLIKIFTKNYGKRMFFIKNVQAPKQTLRSIAFPFVRGQFIGRINDNGLSFLHDSSEVLFPKATMTDITVNAHAAYLIGLVDASMEDGEVDARLFDKLWQALGCLETGYDASIVSNIFEIQILPKFGVAPKLDSCVFCGRNQGIFDYSVRYHGLLCEQHFAEDPRRSNWSPRAAHFIRLFSQIDYENIQSIDVKPETKKAIRSAIDELYEEYVGIHLKSKSFIDQLENIFNPLDGLNNNKV